MDLAVLMQRIQQGDREAFATLYTRYNKTVYQIAYNATGDHNEALEIVKLVFREMYQTICEKGPYLGDLYGWLDALTSKQLRVRRFAQQVNNARIPHQYTAEESAYIQERSRERLNDPRDLDEPDQKKSSILSIVLLSIAAVALAWVLVGLLGSLTVLPKWDLGYNWFNDTIFPLF